MNKKMTKGLLTKGISGLAISMAFIRKRQFPPR